MLLSSREKLPGRGVRLLESCCLPGWCWGWCWWDGAGGTTTLSRACSASSPPGSPEKA